jgi:hypothetical protein
MLLGQRDKVVVKSKEMKKKATYVITESDIVERLTMIGVEIQIIKNLMEERISDSPIEDEEAFVNLCEYYSTLYRLESILFQVIDDSYFDEDDSAYHVSDKQKMYLSIFLRSLYSMKETLLGQNVSIRLH